MLPYSIAMPATISNTAIINMVSLMSTTTTEEFMENIFKPMTASSRYQQQQAIITGEGGRI
ncbi:MAG: hypothetical protein ACJ70Q_02780 [Nitrososphaera sp.]